MLALGNAGQEQYAGSTTSAAGGHAGRQAGGDAGLWCSAGPLAQPQLSKRAQGDPATHYDEPALSGQEAATKAQYTVGSWLRRQLTSHATL